MKKKFVVGCEILYRVQRIETDIAICPVKQMSQRKTDGLYICHRSISGRDLECYRGKRTQPTGLDMASVRDAL
jgi:hypothetical protein